MEGAHQAISQQLRVAYILAHAGDICLYRRRSDGVQMVSLLHGASCCSTAALGRSCADVKPVQ
jgi:hypothetical protein